MPYDATAENLADLFTKALETKRCRAMRLHIMNMEHVDETEIPSKRTQNARRGG